jgi:protein-S-isoprenylcysteine O-methyltransferase Ste14
MAGEFHPGGRPVKPFSEGPGQKGGQARSDPTMNTAEAIMQSLFGFAFLASSAEEVLIPLAAISLGCSIPIIAIIVDYFQKRTKARIIERAIEKGVPIENLALDEPRGSRMPYRSGMVTVAVGIGSIIFGFLIGMAMQQAGEREYYIPRAVFGGSGALVLLIGIALLVNDKMNYKRFFNGNDKSERKDY